MARNFGKSIKLTIDWKCRRASHAMEEDPQPLRPPHPACPLPPVLHGPLSLWGSGQAPPQKNTKSKQKLVDLLLLLTFFPSNVVVMWYSVEVELAAQVKGQFLLTISFSSIVWVSIW